MIIKNKWEEIQTWNIKSKYQAMRTIIAWVKGDINNRNVEQLEFYIKIVEEIVKSVRIPEWSFLLLAKLTANWMTLSGNDRIKIILKSNFKEWLGGDTNEIVIADPSYFNVNNDENMNFQKNRLDFINEGKGYIIHLSNCDINKVQIRIINGYDPVLTFAEYKRVERVSPCAIINVPTGLITVSDNFCNSGAFSFFNPITINSGNYKVRVYFFRTNSDFAKLIIVLCETDKAAKNNFTDTYSY